MAIVEKYHVLDDVPVPPRGGGTYPFEEIGVGQCIFVPGEEFQNVRNHSRIAASAHYHGLRLRRKFTVRLMEDGVRVWRTA